MYEIIVYIALSYYMLTTFRFFRSSTHLGHLGKQPKPVPCQAVLDCIANQADFHPFFYENEEQKDHILSYQGTTNVTERFYNAYYYGCILYPLIPMITLIPLI